MKKQIFAKKGKTKGPAYTAPSISNRNKIKAKNELLLEYAGEIQILQERLDKKDEVHQNELRDVNEELHYYRSMVRNITGIVNTEFKQSQGSSSKTKPSPKKKLMSKDELRNLFANE